MQCAQRDDRSRHAGLGANPLTGRQRVGKHNRQSIRAPKRIATISGNPTGRGKAGQCDRGFAELGEDSDDGQPMRAGNPQVQRPSPRLCLQIAADRATVTGRHWFQIQILDRPTTPILD
jgi:hypothetical protein